MGNRYQIQAIGTVSKKQGDVWIDLEARYEPGLLGLEGFSHIVVLYWFDRNDTPQMRGTLQVHPMKDPTNPLTGVFATHSPKRPNLIAMTVCELLAIEGSRIRITDIDALDGSPVIDIKCYLPPSAAEVKARVPQWIKKANPDL